MIALQTQIVWTRKWRRRAAIALAIVPVVAISGDVGAINAFPSANGSCSGDNFCVYENDWYGGGLGDTPSAVSDYRGYGFWGYATTLNDKTTFAVNLWDTKSVTIYGDINYGNTYETLKHCMLIGNVKSFASFHNDDASSHKNATGANTC